MYQIPSAASRGGGKGQAKPTVKQNLRINNLNLAPGEAKVIRQTLVVRRRPSSAARSTTKTRQDGRLSNITTDSRPEGKNSQQIL